MNVQLYAAVKGTADPAKAAIKVNGSEISELNGANRVKFDEVFSEITSADIYRSCCAPLVDLLVSGYNVSTIVCGSSTSARATLIDGSDKDSLLPRFIEGLFSRLDEEQSIAQEAASRLGTKKDSSIIVTMFEMQEAKATDLISSRRNLSLEEDSEHGDWYRLAEQKRVYSVAEGKQVLKDSWQRSSLYARKGNSNSSYALVVYVDLIMHFESTGEPHRSRYSCLLLPAVDGLVQTTDQSEGIKSVAKLISELSEHLHPDRVINYRECALTKLLQNELGGNCTTKLIACFDPLAELRVQRDFLKLCKNLARVKNFPIMNDLYAQHLVTQYRASIIHYRNLPPPQPLQPPTSPAPAAPVVHVQTPALLPPLPQTNSYGLEHLRFENARLLDQVERLQLKLEQLNSKFTIMANSKAELSAQLVDCEEEKLKATKSYIDMQIQNNKLREEMESMHYELTNKILTLEHDLQVADTERESLTKDVSNLRQQLSQLEVDRKGLADEYISLKTSYMALTDDVDKEVAKNDELTMELLNLINSKLALAQQAESQKLKAEAAALAREEERIKGVVHRLSHGGVNMEKMRSDGRQKDFIEKELFGNQTLHQEQINRMSEQHSEGRKQLLTQIESLEKEVASFRSLARERQQKISFMNARLITVGGENTELKALNNRLQHKIKDINTEYRLRLTKYVEDISNHIDTAGTEKGQESLAQYVNKMIKDVKASHRAREDQLSQAAQSYRGRLETVIHKHEELLCAYRDLRAQVEALGLSAIDLGPDEHELIMSEVDLQSSQQKEIVKLQSELHRLRIGNKQLEDSQIKHTAGEIKSEINKQPPRPGTGTFADLDSWTSVRKQLRNFSEQTLRELEEERAALLSKNVILEEQLKESQDYIDKHLARYKEEINRLRQQLSYQTRS